MSLLRTVFLLSAAFLARLFFSLRYSVKVKGLNEVQRQFQKGDGLLILPNHTAHTDPLILYAWLWPAFKMRPLVVESIARLPLIRTLLPFLHPILIPDLETSLNQFKLRRAQMAIQKVTGSLKSGEHLVVYPSGKFKAQGEEIIGGASGVHEIIQQVPNLPILLVRMTGFWGSRFSKALTGTSPNFFAAAGDALKALFMNLIFFSPRRKITIELELNPKGLPRNESRVALNRALENWYNQYPDPYGNIQRSEPLLLVPNTFWSKETAKIQSKAKKNLKTGAQIQPEVRDKVFAELRRILDSPKQHLEEGMNLTTDLGMDSLNMAELVGFLVKNYDVGELAPDDLDTVKTVLEVASGSPPAVKENLSPSTHHWPEEPHRPDPASPVGKTIPEAFLDACRRMSGFAAMGDDLTGVLRFDRCKRSVLVLAQYFKTIPEERIAVLLPSSAGALIVILALHFANKVPVMLNWTLGPRYLENMMELSGAQRVISSWRFIERVNHVDFGNLVDRTEFLEDIRLSLTFSMKMKGLLLSLSPDSSILKWSHLNEVSEDQYCVILFSSGTEANPKGIPLSHKNILAAVRSSLGNYKEVLSGKDVVHGILPCFHSFGFSIAGFLALLSGLRIAFYPNPTDSIALAESAARWEVTYLPIIPTLLKRLFQVAKKEQLEKVRFFITAGEKTPQELYDKVAELYPHAQLTEGYGLSETSPTLTIMRPGIPPKGVGQLLDGVEATTIDPETHKPLPKGATGEICVKGANVFQGYLGKAPNPFIQIDGATWFRTGDMGYVEKDQTIVLTGRIKRFVKLGGEMVSLGAIEEAIFAECSKEKLIPNDLPALAVSPMESEAGEVKLIFYSTFPIEKEKVNHILKNAGFSNLVKISTVHQLKEIPILGTGKVNYRGLKLS